VIYVPAPSRTSLSLSCILSCYLSSFFFFFFQAEDGIRDLIVTGVQTCALPISAVARHRHLNILPRLQVGNAQDRIFFEPREAKALRILAFPELKRENAHSHQI